ncbi:hypothetical protein ACFYOY_13085 [Streptomyces sp. NPDC007875]|uniref:hypothetical protein n=1 Tax=Streptomyces sp. NPDC007875 TaxID=3364783 RepID=UPI0036A3B03E
MSVNYYAFGPFPGGERIRGGLHIGQSAQGNVFLLRAHPEQGLTTFRAWMEFLRRPGVTIQAEAGYGVPVKHMEEVIRRRRDRSGLPLKNRFVHGYERPGYHVDSEGYEFCELEFC